MSAVTVCERCGSQIADTNHVTLRLDAPIWTGFMVYALCFKCGNELARHIERLVKGDKQ